MERGLVGRVSLSIAAAREQHREQGCSFTRLVAVNFISKERRDGAFAAASQRDRAALSARLNRELGGRLEPVKARRTFEMEQALQRFIAALHIANKVHCHVFILAAVPWIFC